MESSSFASLVCDPDKRRSSMESLASQTKDFSRKQSSFRKLGGSRQCPTTALYNILIFDLSKSNFDHDILIYHTVRVLASQSHSMSITHYYYGMIHREASFVFPVFIVLHTTVFHVVHTRSGIIPPYVDRHSVSHFDYRSEKDWKCQQFLAVVLQTKNEVIGNPASIPLVWHMR